MLYPLLMQAPVKDYIWGGTRLREKYNKVSTADKLAESWELSCHPAGPSVIANGPAKGETLEQYLEKKGMALLGTKGKDCKNFPIMIKLIDAKDNLSVQVHPDDAYALKNGWWAVGTDMDGQDYRTLNYDFNTVLVIGNEGDGISRLIREKCDYVISLPMVGKIESLNASVSAGILMYQIFSTRHPLG